MDQVGRYKILSEVRPDVYHAYDPQEGRNVDVWLVALDDRAAVAAGQLGHRNLVTVYESGEIEGRPYLVTEAIEGKTLAAMIAEGAPLTLTDKVRILIQTAEGLAAGHQAGLIHRDIRPEQVVVLAERDVKVMGFGIVPRESDLLRAIFYMSPEVVMGRGADPSSDIFSFGIVAYEFLIGKHPFGRQELPRVASAIVFEATPAMRDSLPNCPEMLDRIVQRATAKERDNRYANLEEMVRELTSVLPHLESEFTMMFRPSGPIGALPKMSVPFPMGAAAGTATPPDAEDVQFTVFRPHTIPVEKWCALLAFAHLARRAPDAPPHEPDPVDEVKRQAEQILGDDAGQYGNLTEDGGLPVPREGELTFVPSMAGVQFNPRRFSFLWQESVHRAEFHMRAKKELEGQTARGRLTVFSGSVIIADINLSIRVDSSGQADKRPPVPTRHSRYRKIFASYSHKDHAVVEAIGRYAAAFGDEFIRDAVALRAGEVWSKRLLELIEEADVFQLFWSSNSMGSRFVADEWRHAVSLRRESFVRPVFWETPMPTAPGLPPEELSGLHFHQIPGYSRAPETGAWPTLEMRVPNYGSAPQAARPADSDPGVPPLEDRPLPGAPQLRPPQFQVPPAPKAQPATPPAVKAPGISNQTIVIVMIVLLAFLAGGLIIIFLVKP